ncbi:MAG: hypothetical protein NVSMB49_03590 [Ktedonobacteraceae bacterium]
MTPSSFPIVGIGASAGGLKAFTQILEYLPTTAGMAYVCVQHLDPTHVSLLSDLLAHVTKMPVYEIKEDMTVEPDHVYVLSPGTDLTIENGMLKPAPRTLTDGLYLPIDSFFRSLAVQQKRQAIGVILSGTASDGTLGLKAIKAEGGITFAQDATAQYQGMPQSALAAGYVDTLLPPEGIARELLRISQHSYVKPSHVAEPEMESTEQEQEFPDDEQAFQQILLQLRRKTSVNFAAYKPTTIKRRIMRRLALQKKESIAEYADFLRENATEVEVLYQDMLINVTSFFRDPLAFQAITREVFPALLETKSSGEAIRVWVPGCSTGEEAYSLAMCLLEFLAERSITLPIQIFGTDIDEIAIQQARTGIYAPSALTGISPNRLQRFFLKIDGSYQISKAVRELCVFARHNVCIDPPFSRLDLLSCRNLLIYLGPALQKKVMQTFHYALSPQGFLLLGASESIDAGPKLFVRVDSKQRLYAKNATRTSPLFLFTRRSSAEIPQVGGKEEYTMQENTHGAGGIGNIQKEADRLLLARYVPASVVINAEMEILHFRGHTGPYLEPAPGKASFQVLNMARDGLAPDLRTAIALAKKENSLVRREGIVMPSPEGERRVTIEVLPLKTATTDRSFLVVFTEMPSSATSQGEASPQREYQGDAELLRVKDRRIASLELELASTREELQFVVQELEAANEELQTSNEEILSSNEELQSLNEEMETSTEEIQASNEELLTLNQELQAARDYTDAIVETVREPLLILDANMCIRRANGAFYSFFQETPEAMQQHFLYEIGNGQWNIPSLRALLEEVLPKNYVFQDFEVDHVFASLGHKTLLLNARRIAGTKTREPLILLAFEDVTERRELERHKDAFLAIASHELKTPVTSLKAYAQLLRRQYTKAGDEQAAHKLATIEEQANRLTHLIGMLLDTTQLQTRTPLIHTRLFDVTDLVRSIVEEVQRTTQKHQISLEGTIHQPFTGDPERISQVLTNVLSNAINYSPKSEPILVRLREDSDAVILSVQDFGMGIPTDKQAFLFERFYRINHSGQTVIPGLGLGLYISSELVKQHGGQMWVESREGEGSTFFARFPLVPTQSLSRTSGHDVEA